MSEPANADSVMNFLRRYWLLMSAFIFAIAAAFQFGVGFNNLSALEQQDRLQLTALQTNQQTIQATQNADHEVTASTLSNIQVQLAELAQQLQDIKANQGNGKLNQ